MKPTIGRIVHVILRDSTMRVITRPGIITHLTGLPFLDYQITVNVAPAVSRGEIAREEKAIERLKSYGVNEGMRVGIRATNCYPWIVYDIALLELRAVLHHAVRQRELADVVQQPGGVGQLLVVLVEAAQLGDVAAEHRHRGAVAGRAVVALVEGSHEAREDAPGEVRVLTRLQPRLGDQVIHVRDRGDHQDGDAEGREAPLDVRGGEHERQAAADQHAREQLDLGLRAGQDRPVVVEGGA